MDKTVDKRRLNAGNFIENNGKVLRTINILRYKYNKLTGVGRVLLDEGVSEDEFLDCINFLSEEKYIDLRSIASHTSAMLSDSDYSTLEAKRTSKGIRLLAGGIDDTMIEV